MLENIVSRPAAIEETSPFVLGLSRLPVPTVTYGADELAKFIGIVPLEVLDATKDLPGIIWWCEGHRFNDYAVLRAWLDQHDTPLGPKFSDVEIVLPRRGHEAALAKAFDIGPDWKRPS